MSGGSRCPECFSPLYMRPHHNLGCSMVGGGAGIEPPTQAPVLPPVVPDSEPTDLDALRMDLSDEERWTRGWVLGPKIHEVRCIECGKTGTHRVCAACFVPAVTDDEAAPLDRRDVWFILDALACYNVTGDAKVQRDRIVADLRANGYAAMRAVREAVGPTTPQTFRITKGQRQYLAETVKRDRRRGPTT